MINLETKEYWNKVASKKKFTIPLEKELFQEYVEAHSNILDIGCGYGRILKELYDMGYENLQGVDIAEEMIKLARNEYPYIDFSVKNGEYLDYDNNSIDCVLLMGVLTSIYKEQEEKNLLQEVNRVLKPKGILYMNEFLLNDSELYRNRYEEFQNKYGEYGIFETLDQGVFRHYSMEYLNQLLGEYFQKEKVKQLTYGTLNGHQSKGICYIGRKD